MVLLDVSSNNFLQKHNFDHFDLILSLNSSLLKFPFPTLCTFCWLASHISTSTLRIRNQRPPKRKNDYPRLPPFEVGSVRIVVISFRNIAKNYWDFEENFKKVLRIFSGKFNILLMMVKCRETRFCLFKTITEGISNHIRHIRIRSLNFLFFQHLLDTLHHKDKFYVEINTHADKKGWKPGKNFCHKCNIKNL